MEELKSEQTEVTISEEEQKKVAINTEDEVSLGKFKDAQSLLKAYNSLQSEFTKRCQRIKELEGAVKADKKDAENLGCPDKNADKTARDRQADFPTDTAKCEGSIDAARNTADEGQENLKEQKPIKPEEVKGSLTDEDRDYILKSYLKNILEGKGKTIVIGGEGVGVKTPSIKPKTIAEAGVMAKSLF